MTTEEQELFQLSNGRYIMDKDLSQKMFYIKESKPERSHQISGTGYSWDESGMAELFSECYKNDTRFCPEAKCWYTYSNGAWRKDIGSLLVAEKIKNGPQDMVYQIVGHADQQTGTKAGNKRVAEHRAKRVFDFLVSKGVNPKQLNYEGKGNSPDPFKKVQAANRAAIIQ